VPDPLSQLEALLIDDSGFFITFGIDLVVIALFTFGLYFRRHKRRDLFVTFCFFNIALFMIVRLITTVEIGIGVSFGLFALLAIIRLRSEEYSSNEMAYFFGSLTLAIVNGLGNSNYPLILSMDAAILLGMFLLDHPRLLSNMHHSKVTLDTVYDNDRSIREALETLLKAKVMSFSVMDIDYVRDTTRLSVQYRRQDTEKQSAGPLS
jgi:hypothetical protein